MKTPVVVLCIVGLAVAAAAAAAAQFQDFTEESETTPLHHAVRRQTQTARNIPTGTASTPSQDLERPAVASAGRDGKAAEGVAGAGGVGVAAAPRVYVENKYRPVFTRCASASLEEAKPPGTVVTEVRATDDDEVGPAGSVFYTILRAGSDKEFDVDSTTGVIRSSKAFDRDEPNREKIAYVTVKATDKGTPPLETICTFNVTIRDINDNVPMFDKVSYEESVPKDLEVNRTVMRITAADVDFGENARIAYALQAGQPQDRDYFDVDRTTGIIQLKKPLTQNEGYRFQLTATATDNGTTPQSASVAVVVRVASAEIKPPSFVGDAAQNPAPLSLAENWVPRITPDGRLVTFEARSNVDLPDLYFELVKGQTQQTNSDETFRILEFNNSVAIVLAKPLDYETVTQYHLTVRVKNAAGVAAELVQDVVVTDVNDESPTFIAVDSGSVLENSAPHTYVLKIQATDKDGSFPNNWVRYKLASYTDKFEIDENSGEIRTLVALDREQRKSYQLIVVAFDGAESALTPPAANENRKSFQIEVADVNDNPPYFPQAEYFAEIAENADIGAKVSELVALDNDTDSELVYDIIAGNTDQVFSIEPKTGQLKVERPLDYESIKMYHLVVEVDDGKQSATTKVTVKIINVNDNKPIFQNQNPMQIAGILEEEVPREPIMTVRATDPDDDSADPDPMKIKFTLSGSNAAYFSISAGGELRIVRKLDRDKPAGRKDWSVFVVAQDQLDGVVLESTLEVVVILEDINDNAPFLDMANPVVWYENQAAGRVALLNASDYDEPSNGPPFAMRLADDAEDAVRQSFKIDGSPQTSWSLLALRPFDREERKSYAVPIVISDSGKPKSQSATSTLTVIIGDRNDNPMFDGQSSILVYNYKGMLGEVEIGRVYVEDKDDWDLPDKVFSWDPDHHPDEASSHFTLASFGGHITVKHGVPAAVYQLHFQVVDNIRNDRASALVEVHVKDLPEEAVRRSGSMRFYGATQEEFVEGAWPQRLVERLASLLGVADAANVDVFTVVDAHGQAANRTVDVRYSAHGSPYYDPVRLNGLAGQHAADIEQLLGLQALAFGIDECSDERGGACAEAGSCTNRLVVSETPYRVVTNTSSMVGVEARTVAECVCQADARPPPPGLASCAGGPPCLNGGQCTGLPHAPCKCPDGFGGPQCQGLDVSFGGTGWAWYEPLATCAAGHLTLTLTTRTANGLLLYAGPVAAGGVAANAVVAAAASDFVALELSHGAPVLHIDLGSGTKRLDFGDQARSLLDGKAHELEVRWNPRSVQMIIDQCQSNQVWCSASMALSGASEYLNVQSGPLQVGGVAGDLQQLRLRFGWASIPEPIGFSGCIQNLTFNGRAYDLATPALARNATASCDGITLPVASGALGVELIVVLVLLLLLVLVLVLAGVAYRRRSQRDNLKEFHDDIRENIINYSDEGGGEGDMTGYDLSVLRMTPDGKPLIARQPNDPTQPYAKLVADGVQQRVAMSVGGGEVPDISQFLDDNKGRVDRDPDGLPYDDLRHYAYEGDGNSMASLSSLASGTDDGDLDFDCLSEFGPRFKKLADMYGDHSDQSDTDSDSLPLPPPLHAAAAADEEQRQSGSESWC